MQARLYSSFYRHVFRSGVQLLLVHHVMDIGLKSGADERGFSIATADEGSARYRPHHLRSAETHRHIAYLLPAHCHTSLTSESLEDFRVRFSGRVGEEVHRMSEISEAI